MSKRPVGGMWRLDPQYGTSKLAQIECDTGVITINCGADTPDIARLVVAAPDMLNALKEVVRDWRHDQAGDAWIENSSVGRAIAKAEGR